MGVVMLCNVIATVSFLGPVSSYFAALPYAAPVTLVVTLLAIIYVEGKPVIDLGEAARYVPWETLMFLGAIMFYASIFGGDEYGVNLLLQNLLTPLVNGIPLSVAILLGLAGACIFTNLASNSVAVIVARRQLHSGDAEYPGNQPCTSSGLWRLYYSGFRHCHLHAQRLRRYGAILCQGASTLE